MDQQEETLDDLLGGKLKIFQRKRGYRFSLDSLLLAHFVRLESTAKFVELGLGSGVVSLILCYRWGCTAAGLELQEQLAEMAARSFRLNKMDDSIEIIRGDVRKAKKHFQPGVFDSVVFNPPYRKRGSGRISKDPEKALARHELSSKLEDFVSAAEYLAKCSGTVFAIYPASRAVELICALRAHALEPKRIRIVHSGRGTGAEFILVEALKGGGEELEIQPPLYIYEGDGKYTEEMQGIFSELCRRQSSCVE